MKLKTTTKFIAFVLMFVFILAGCKSKKYTDLPDFLDVYPYNGAVFTTQEVQELDGIVVEVNYWLIEEKEIDGDTLLRHSTLLVNGKTIPNETARWVHFGGVSFSLVWEMPLPEGKYTVTYQLIDDTGFTHEYSWDFEIVSASETASPPIMISPTPPTLTSTLVTSPTPVPSPTIYINVAPTATPLFYPVGNLQSNCLAYLPELPPDVNFDSTIVFESYKVEKGVITEFDTHLFNLTKNETMQGEHGTGIVVSPDRGLMAFTIEEPGSSRVVNELVVADASGKRLQTIPWEEDWRILLRWMDDEHLVIGLEDTSGTWRPLPLLIFNPFTNERQYLQVNFPDFLTLPLLDNSGWFGVIYDPALTMAVYPRYFENDNEKFTFALWDLVHQKQVVSFEDIFFGYSVSNDIFLKTQWAPDGSQFVFENIYSTREQKDFELYRVTRDGQVEKLTSLGDYASINDEMISWSPDGQHLAIFISTPRMKAQAEYHLAILDIVTKQITDTCVWFKEKPFEAELIHPVWSPTGDQLVVGQTQGHNGVLLFDFTRGFYTQITEDIEPVGWMVGP